MNKAQLMDLVQYTIADDITKNSYMIKQKLLGKITVTENYNDVDNFIYHEQLQMHNYNENLARAIQNRFDDDVKYFESIQFENKIINYFDIAINTYNDYMHELSSNLKYDLFERYGVTVKNCICNNNRASGTASIKTVKKSYALDRIYHCININLVDVYYYKDSYTKNESLLHNFSDDVKYFKSCFIKTIRYNKLDMLYSDLDNCFNGLYLYALKRFDDSENNKESKSYKKFVSFKHAFFYSLRLLKMLSVKLGIMEVNTLVSYMTESHKRKTLKTYFDSEKLSGYADKRLYLNNIECKHDYNRIIIYISKYYTSDFMLNIVNNYSCTYCDGAIKKAVSRIFERYGKQFNVSFNVLSKEDKLNFLYKVYKRCKYNEYIISKM